MADKNECDTEKKSILLREKTDLDVSWIALSTLINGPTFDELPPLERSMLEVQLAAMLTYSTCLQMRINAISDPFRGA